MIPNIVPRGPALGIKTVPGNTTEPHPMIQPKAKAQIETPLNVPLFLEYSIDIIIIM